MSNVRFNFILPGVEGFTLEELAGLTLEQSGSLYALGEFIWAHQTYVFMRDLGLPVKLSNDLDPAAINLAHGNRLRLMIHRADCFCVSLQADYPHYPLADYHIVQNKAQESRNSFFIPHWPLYGQLPRSGTRTEVKTIAYQGNRNFCRIDAERLNADLKPHDMRFHFLAADEWQDLSHIDVLVGIRTFGKKRYKRKPPSKLINAWHAQIPFIAGGDSAYAQIGMPGVDFLQVYSYEELLRALVRLKQDPAFYSSLVEAGRRKSVGYTSGSIADRWQDLLETEISRAYERWRKRPYQPLRYRIRTVRYAAFTLLRQSVKKCYSLPSIKYIRDHYYDPVK